MTDEDHTKRERSEPGPAPTKREGASSDKAAATFRDEEAGAAAKTDYLARGMLVGRYVVLDVLGEGGMGVVYSAFDPELDRKVAIKLLQTTTGGSGGSESAWLVREAQALARLSHPNVVAVHDVGTLAGDRVFVAMELVDGETLRDWLKEKPRGWREVVPIMLAAGAGLAAAHGAGLVHRDFKPDNVIVGKDGRARVMDFGLARLHRSELDDVPARRDSDLAIETRSPLSEKLTIAGTVVGTPAYMAPEIYTGEPADARADQFAYGVALYEALYRTRPYERKDLMPPVSAPKPKTPPDVGVPAQIQRVVMRAISIDPAQRYASMDELLAELAIDPTARRRRIVGGAAAIALVGLGLGGVYTMKGHSRHAPCRGIEARLVGVWDPSIKTSIKGAFGATKKSFAPASYAGVERALDHVTGEWTKAVTESCEATHVRGEQSEEVLSLRGACFDEQLDGIRALTALLAEADPSMVEKGDKMVFGLEAVAKCANVAVLRAPGLPAPEVRERVTVVRKRIAEARAALVAGKYVAALAASQTCIETARPLGYEPAIVEALQVHGAAMLTTGNFDGAAKDFTEATYAAIRGKRDDFAADAGLSTAMVISQSKGKPDEARIWLGHAEAAAARIGADHAIEHQRLTVAGMIASESGDLVTATAMHEKALAVTELMNDPALLFGDEINLGATYSRANAYAKAIPHFERAVKLREASVGPDHPDIALVLSNLGAAYTHANDPKRARAAFERSLAIRENYYGKNSPVLIATLDNFAEFVRGQGDVATALALQERALALCKIVPGTGHPMYHQLATDYGDTLVIAKRFAEAHVQFDATFAFEQAASSTIIPATQASRAYLALAEQAWTDAASFAEKSIAGYEAVGGKDNPALWRPLTALGKAKIGENKPADARLAFERAVAIATKGSVDESDIAPTREALSHLPP